MPRKPRSDSKLANLPPAVREELAERLLDGDSYSEAKEWLHMDHCVVTSESALGGFFRHFCSPLRLQRAAAAAKALPEFAPGLMEGTDAAMAAQIQQAFFEVMADRDRDPKTVMVFGSLLADLMRGRHAAAKLDFDRRKHTETNQLKTETLALQREKFETDAAALALKFVAELKTIAANRTLTEPAKIEAVRRRLFGVAPTQEAQS